MSTRTQPAWLEVTGLGLMAPGADRPALALEPTPLTPGWFDVATALPGRGYKRLPPGCLYLLAAARAAVADGDGDGEGDGGGDGRGDWFASIPSERRAAVVGTNNAGAHLQDLIDRTIVDHGAAELSPATAPFMAMSMFGGRLSPEHRLNGFNLTTNSPAVAGLEALQVAARALAAGRAAAVLVGAVEDEPGVGPYDYSGADVGAAVLVCGPPGTAAARGARAYGRCRVHSAFLGPGGPEGTTSGDGPEALSGVAEALDPLWEALDADAGPPVRIDAVLDDSPVGKAVAGWLAERADGRTRVASVDVPTGAGCLTPLRRVVGLLANGPWPGTDRSDPHTSPAAYAVLTASAQGTVALAEIDRTAPERS